MADQLIQRSFTGGELDPAMRARADTAAYVNGLGLCSNFIVKSQGGVYSRQGTLFIDALGDSDKRGRLVGFSFNTTQNYILVFEENEIRVIKDDGYVLNGLIPYVITTTYTEAEIPRLVFTQDADVLTITHPSHDPATLSRTDHDVWTLADIDYSGGVTAPGSVAVTTVGTASTGDDKTYSYVVTTVIGDSESIPSAVVSQTVDALSVTWGSRITWGAVADADFYRIYRDPSNGSGVYAYVGDSKTLAFEDYNVAPDTSDAPPSDYLPFANANNKPSTVGSYQQRQIFANTINEPQKLFGGQSGEADSMRFSSPARSTDAVFFTIKAKQVNEIRHVVGMDTLFLLTSGGEWAVNLGQSGVMSPFNFGFNRISRWGSSWTAPVEVGDSIIFVQEKGTKVRDLTQGINTGVYAGNELSIMANHLFTGFEIGEMSYALEPFGILWVIRNDGKLLGMTYQREHGVWAWHQHDTDGEFESVATITDSGYDAPYFIIKRVINGVTKRYIEKMQPRYVSAPEDVWCVDCGLQYTGTAVTVITGLSHLEGKAVAVVADGNVVEGLTVDSGQITIPRESTKVTVGLSFLPALETLDIDPAALRDTYRGKEISVGKVRIDVQNSRGGWVGGIKDDGTADTLMEIKPRFQSDGYNALTLKNYREEVVIQPDWGNSGKLRIEQRAPMPLAILAIIPNVDIS